MNKRVYSQKIAVLVPCYNEEQTIYKVVSDFRRELPNSEVYVYDNRSSDHTWTEAVRAGAIVVREKERGKGAVVKRMFEEVDADIYVLVDGDDTYPAEEVHALMTPIIRDEADMVVGVRLDEAGDRSFRKGHRLGNVVFARLLSLFMGVRLRDIFSGYRVMNRAFVKDIPILSAGFEIETELTMQALVRRKIIMEIPTSYRSRPEGSFSKLRTFGDGFRILLALLTFVRDLRPLTFFGGASLALFGLSGITGAVWMLADGSNRLSAILPGLTISLIVLAVIVLLAGIIINTIVTRVREVESLLKKRPER